MKTRIHYTGKVISLNHYKSLNWRKLKKIVDPVKLSFLALVMAKRMPKLAYIELRVFHNTKLDIDNVTGTIKIFVDVLRHCNVIQDDDRRYFDYLSIQYTPQLKKGELIFEITGEPKTKKK